MELLSQRASRGTQPSPRCRALLDTRTRATVFAFRSWPINTTQTDPGSLGDNQLCGVDSFGHGTYTAEGITKLCEGLKGSAVTSLSCAAAPSACSLLRQLPLKE